MLLDPIRNPVVRAAPLSLATVYALVVILCWGGEHAYELIALCAGYASVSVAAAIFAASLMLAHVVWCNRRRGETTAVASLVRTFVSERWRVDRGLSLWQPLLTFILIMTTLTFFKQAVLPGAGFRYGPWFADADRALFGTDPWRITHRVFSSPWSTQALDLAYHAWFAPMTLGIAFCVFAKPGSILAWRYMVSYCFLWIVLGSCMAYAFPAAGPVYFANFQLETERFAELSHILMSEDATLRMQGADGLSALGYQHHLLLNFQHGMIVFGGGISAMPSLHNAMAVLFACVAWPLSRSLGRIMTGYAVIVWIGSIHLGWHYAVDGLVSCAATIGLWSLSGIIAKTAFGGASPQLRFVPSIASTVRAKLPRRSRPVQDR